VVPDDPQHLLAVLLEAVERPVLGGQQRTGRVAATRQDGAEGAAPLPLLTVVMGPRDKREDDGDGGNG
jgi:hypothetical protein